ncbi:hypothetical protein EDD22DRAFT_953328 [Suillus occidentalis]|nr:hypothetical protein EDD22DRAFT_953328 [Suillus occidentalis]
MAIPEALHLTPLRVTNPADVRALAVQQMKDKKAAKKAGEVPPSQEANTVEEGTQGATALAPAFDWAPAKSRVATKLKGKASASTRGKKKAASLVVEQPVSGPSRQQPTLSVQQNPMAMSYQFVPSPLQALHHPPPLQIRPLQTSHHPPLPPSVPSYPYAGSPRLHNTHAPPVHPTHIAPHLGLQLTHTMHHPHTTSSHQS